MKKLLAAGILALASIAGSAQAATTVSFSGGNGTLPTNTTVFQNFDSIASGTMISANTYVTSTSSGLAFRPAYGSTGNFAAVLDGGSYTVAFGPTSMFSFVLGSLDAFNVLTLRYTDGSTSVYNGGAIVNSPTLFDSGSRTDSQTNGVVSYAVTSGALISGATFASAGGNSFEFDNLAAAVPEPAMWGMMILGFGLVGGALRRRPSTTAKLRFA